jgi:signal transduction histidine kinase
MEVSVEFPPSDIARAVEAAKLQALYNFAYGLSHEINNPLANIATRAQTLLVDEQDPERRRKLATIVQQAFRAHEMIADLMLFARPPVLRPEPTDLSKLADAVVAELRPDAADQGTSLTRGGHPGPLIATVDRTQIAVALKALIQNSLEAVATGGSVEVVVEIVADQVLDSEYSVLSTEQPPRRIDVPNENGDGRSPSAVPRPLSPAFTPSALPAPHFVLAVTDSGPGIAAEIRPHIFDPFFSGREAGRGLGLGLSKAWRIVELHGGQIDVVSEAQQTTFAIALPAVTGS